MTAPATFEPVPTPETNFETKPNLSLTAEERFFIEKITINLTTIANLLTRGLSIANYANLRILVKTAMELIAGHQMVLLFGASEKATVNSKEKLLSKFFNEAEKLKVLDYMAEGKMFSDEIFEKNKKAKEVYLLMTGLFNLEPFYLQ